MARMAAAYSPVVGWSENAYPHWNEPAEVSMIHVGGSAGVLGALSGSPTSSSTMTSTKSAFAADAET